VQAKRVLHYLKRTEDMAILYKRGKTEIVGYSDASWGNDLEDRKSISGNVFLFAGGPISWLSKKQEIIALSSTAAEYISLAKAAEQAIFLKTLLEDFGVIQKNPIKIYQDNNGARFIATNKNNTKKSKHIEIKYHYVRDLIEKKLITVPYLATSEMPADMLTKPVSKVLMERFTSIIGMKA
jgi:hypothetical protein